MLAIGIEFGQTGFNRSNVGYDTRIRDVWHYHLKGLQGIFHRCGINEEVGVEFLYFLELGHSLGVERKPQFVGVCVENCNFMVHIQHIAEECAHFPGTYD